jgi:hypothetical protein
LIKAFCIERETFLKLSILPVSIVPGGRGVYWHRVSGRTDSFRGAPPFIFLLSLLRGPAPHKRRVIFFSMENVIDHDALKTKFIAASGEMAALLETEILILWNAESQRFIDATARGEDIILSPLWLAIMATIWAHITDGTTLEFPPQLAAHYVRAPMALCN